MLDHLPARLTLAPMEGITDAPMRALQTEIGAFRYCVSEFVRVAAHVVPARSFIRAVPELTSGAQTPSGVGVGVQILGGDPDRMAASARQAVLAGARHIDLNFGCPAKTVNRNDGGAALLKAPTRIREIVRAVRDAVPAELPVSAKMRLGWDSIRDIHVNSQMAFEGGCAWLTVHCRTRAQAYAPPVFWSEVRTVRKNAPVPIVINGDIWTLDDWFRCQEESGCDFFMLGRAALANPQTPILIARQLGLPAPNDWDGDWIPLLQRLLFWSEHFRGGPSRHDVKRLKQWLQLAARYGQFPHFDPIKRLESAGELFRVLGHLNSHHAQRSLA